MEEMWKKKQSDSSSDSDISSQQGYTEGMDITSNQHLFPSTANINHKASFQSSSIPRKDIIAPLYQLHESPLTSASPPQLPINKNIYPINEKTSQNCQSENKQDCSPLASSNFRSESFQYSLETRIENKSEMQIQLNKEAVIQAVHSNPDTNNEYLSKNIYLSDFSQNSPETKASSPTQHIAGEKNKTFKNDSHLGQLGFIDPKQLVMDQNQLQFNTQKLLIDEHSIPICPQKLAGYPEKLTTTAQLVKRESSKNSKLDPKELLVNRQQLQIDPQQLAINTQELTTEIDSKQLQISPQQLPTNQQLLLANPQLFLANPQRLQDNTQQLQIGPQQLLPIPQQLPIYPHLIAINHKNNLPSFNAQRKNNMAPPYQLHESSLTSAAPQLPSINNKVYPINERTIQNGQSVNKQDFSIKSLLSSSNLRSESIQYGIETRLENNSETLMQLSPETVIQKGISNPECRREYLFKNICQLPTDPVSSASSRISTDSKAISSETLNPSSNHERSFYTAYAGGYMPLQNPYKPVIGTTTILSQNSKNTTNIPKMSQNCQQYVNWYSSPNHSALPSMPYTMPYSMPYTMPYSMPSMPTPNQFRQPIYPSPYPFFYNMPHPTQLSQFEMRERGDKDLVPIGSIETCHPNLAQLNYWYSPINSLSRAELYKCSHKDCCKEFTMALELLKHYNCTHVLKEVSVN